MLAKPDEVKFVKHIAAPFSGVEDATKKCVNDWIRETTAGVVQTGPFKGMEILPDEAWHDGGSGTKLLGCYEQELHDFFEDEIARLAELPNPQIVDVGCAEGYYAVGLTRRLPKARMWAYDISDKAMEIAAGNASLNGVYARIVFGASEEEMFAAPDLVVMDCEGAEKEYLQPDKYPGLTKATICVECHEFPGADVTNTIGNRFRHTHNIWLVVEGGRNPNVFEFLRPLSSLMRWLAVSEGRPGMMHWLVMRPKAEEKK